MTENMTRITTDESFLAGLILPKIYESVFTPQEKHEWKKQFDFHHGALGAVACVLGILTNSPKLAAFGAGLAIEDWKDRNNWFKGIRF